MLSAGILSGKYRPGDRLNESQIARELSISRIPVREALSQLQEQGLVQNRERRGMFVTNIGPEEVEQIFALRFLLESEALKLARGHMTPQILASLEKLIAQMDAWDGNLLEAAALDLEFHRTLWKACGQSLSGTGAECGDGAPVRAQDPGTCHPGRAPLAHEPSPHPAGRGDGPLRRRPAGPCC